MSVNYLSFGSISKLHNNTPLTVSSIGELSNKARTYAKDPGVYSTDSAVSETVLYNFVSKRDNVDFVMTQAVAGAEIKIGDWLYAQNLVGNITASQANTLTLLQNQFTNNIAITDIGEMVTDNKYWFPSYVQGTHTVGTETHTFTLWFGVAYFLEQFPIVSFTIVHPVPIAEIDSLYDLNYIQLAARLELETPSVIEDRVKIATDQVAWPYSFRDVDAFQVLDLINTPSFVMAYWRWMAWGNSTDSEDQRYDQIKAEILAASKHAEAEWEEKIPDLFNPLEYYVIPYYNRLGLLNKTVGTRLYSPVVDLETERDLVDVYLTPNMTDSHVIKSMQVISFMYKSLACAFVGKPNIRAGMEKVLTLYPDYTLMPSTDPDFQLMSSVTTTFILKMEALLAAAEVVTPDSLPPTGIARITRFNKAYVSCRIGSAKFIAITKWQMIQDGHVEA